ncbi:MULTISPECIES: zinc-dependent metalloprotease [Streptomyces]|uniref:Coenzyme F420 biosynthesis-associated protein n=2 Tax=Streptomyces TaxID=1883 RepID=A0A0U3D1V4_STRGL|nr:MULTISPECIES: zinc-dependent metalloprotease [Streptomyces]ALU94564.1 coenzyme F420 biosynthesis-associated protein [Streptomyces globisporus C-1027]APS20831.1 coenzyme F420 biosynthesis-associated protein [Streptomyces sp. Tue 6075]MBK3559498.1 zinc-dependent metalloprotease [Streptomyces sp. MBT56]MBK3617374.1 zinc-dependent metalloprotease [Streptomyces sp. MBT98]MBK6044738.1 zinc-dependent metalloprotease [Streptomyces sp. MBT55]
MTSIGGAQMVDWNLAVATATRLVRPGPDISREEARAVVAELRRHAKASEEHVRLFTRMIPEGTEPEDTPVLVVDRPGWIKANVAGFRELLQPLLAKMESRRSGGPGGAVLGAVGGKVTGVELGMLLSFLASRVLGQYETFAPATRELPASANGGGRLLLVAPNIVHVERELDVDPHDFRLWVALHEETHRTQFTGVPWLRDHLRGEIQTFLDETDVDPTTFLERLREAAQSLSGGRPEGEQGESDTRSLVDIVQTPAQREVLGRLTAVMSLLEGHADYVMDGVGPDVVGSVSEIREKFQQRRAQGAGRLDQALRKLLGLDAKLRQYKDGEKFVRSVVDEVGMDGFNRVWTSPNTLPTKAEIAKPADWVARVHRKAES